VFTDVSDARGGRKQKQAFEKVFRAMVGFLDHDVRNKDRATTAQAIAALCIGGMVIARAMDDRKLADALRNTCLVVALRLGGWQRKTSS